MRIGIIGAGVSGLTIGLRLVQAGHQVTIWEANPELGGLASGFKEPEWDWPLERHYHHIFTSDTAVQKIAHELSVPIQFYHPQTSLWYQNRSFRFDSPLDIWKFPYLSVISKAQLSFWLAYLKVSPFWHLLENQSARTWIIQHMGQQTWQVLWQPLFTGKFGQETDRVSATWFWARIYKRSQSLGYFDGGFQALAEAMGQAIRQLGGQILLNTPVHRIQIEKATKIGVIAQSQSGIYDRIVIAGPSSLLTKLVNPLPGGYLEKINWLKSIGAVNLVLALKQQFLTDNTYWLNINDSNIPFLAVVEHTNMIDPGHYGGDHLVYIGNYLPAQHQFFQLNDQQLLDKFLPHLQRINPAFNRDWVRKSWVFKAPFAQHIVTPHYREILPDMTTPIPHLWWVSMQHVYPWDRGTNYAVEWGNKVTKLILESI